MPTPEGQPRVQWQSVRWPDSSTCELGRGPDEGHDGAFASPAEYQRRAGVGEVCLKHCRHRRRRCWAAACAGYLAVSGLSIVSIFADEGLVKEDKCHVRGVFKYSNGDR